MDDCFYGEIMPFYDLNSGQLIIVIYPDGTVAAAEFLFFVLTDFSGNWNENWGAVFLPGDIDSRRVWFVSDFRTSKSEVLLDSPWIPYGTFEMQNWEIHRE